MCLRELHQGELVGVHGAGANIAGFARPHDIVEGFHSLLDWGMRVNTMDLKDVDVVGLKTVQAAIHSTEDGTTGEA